MNPSASALTKPSEPTKSIGSAWIFLAAYILILALSHFIYSRTYFNVEFLGNRSAIWSNTFIPLLTFAIHLLLIRLLKFPVFVFIIGLDALVDVAVATHWQYFGGAPSFVTLITALREVSMGVIHSGGFIPKNLILIISIKLLLLLGLAFHIKSKLNTKFVWRTALVALSGLIFAYFMRSPADAARPQGYEVAAKIHGVYSAAVSELIFRDRIDNSQPDSEHPKSPTFGKDCIEVPSAFTDRILAIQVESLDWEVLGYRHQGVEATPFLNSISNRTLLARLNPRHSAMSGSSGADFQYLTMALPPNRRLALRGDDLKALPSLPRFLSEQGIPTIAMHGNTAAFWSRGLAYPKLGVAKFIERKDYPAQDGGWGASDQTFFEHNARIINQTPGPAHFLLITLSSHAPFRWVKDDVFPSGGMAFDYLNSIHYVDRCLASFFRNLHGKFLVVIYGDHASNVQNAQYNSKPSGREYVPGMVFLLDNGEVHPPVVTHPPADLLSGHYEIRSLGLLVKDVVEKSRTPLGISQSEDRTQ